MNEPNNTGKVVGALLLGAAIGGILGVLFAPDKGSETRKKILSKGNDLTDALKDKFNEFLEEAKEEAGILKEKADEMVENGMTKSEKYNIN
jgi:gas vesicle protein